MRLVSITLNDVRRFTAPVQISGIGPGLNVLCAPNENGKSTLFDALQAVFFTPHRSKGKEIKGLRPHAGGAPEVTVEVDTADGRFRVFKRWMSRDTAEVWQADRLIAKADEAEAWLARLTNGGADGGPAGLLWVRQGAGRLDEDKTRESDRLTVRRSLMTSVTNEVEALTGGRRMDIALARARGDLAVMLTATGKVLASGPLGKVEQDIAALSARHADLDAISRRLTHALDRRAQVRRALTDLQDAAAAQDRRQRLAEATTALDAARRHAQAVDTAERDLSMAQLQVNEATARRSALVSARDTAARAVTLDDQARSLARIAKSALERADQQAAGQLEAVTAARTRRGDAERLFRAALHAEAARAAQTRRLELVERLATVAALAADLSAARRAAAIGPDTATMKALDDQMQQVTVLRTLQTRAATQITMTYQGADRLSVAGTPLAEGQPTAILTRTAIDLPGLGTLTIHPADGSDGSVRLQRAEAQLASLLAQSDCLTLDAARRAATLRDTAATRVKEITARVSALAPKGVAAVEAELTHLPDPAPDATSLPPAAEAQQIADAAALSLHSAEQVYEQARAQAEQDRLADARATAAAQTAAASRADAETALATFGDLAAADRACDAALTTATLALGQASDRRAALVASAPDLARAEASLARATSVATGAAAEITALAQEQAVLDKEIDLSSGQGVAEEIADVTLRLSAARAQHDRLTFERDVLRELIASLEGARDTARERYFEPIMAELQPLLRLLWPDAILKFDGESLLPVALIRDGQTEDIGILSGGTQEQIALFVRLAFARLLAKSGRHAPVILDDALVYTDDDRIERVFDALHGQAGDLQIIVLSCRQRAFRGLGGQKLTFTPARS